MTKREEGVFEREAARGRWSVVVFTRILAGFGEVVGRGPGVVTRGSERSGSGGGGGDGRSKTNASSAVGASVGPVGRGAISGGG